MQIALLLYTPGLKREASRPKAQSIAAAAENTASTVVRMVSDGEQSLPIPDFIVRVTEADIW